ncbi:hypothetical protein Pmani_019682 [Petrolisthes manimaculis]|uniref:NACHT domain-containing protein n=1 Tax=Petrolisthes manimaculis TaxID=1843537 RepID=A0AAE1PHT4_9EUCA|nr:hypothetical protein Pmani_019682 [Petrolisthes manimaculis]
MRKRLSTNRKGTSSTTNQPNIASQSSNMQGTSSTTNQPNIASQSTNRKGTSSTTNQPNMDYDNKLIYTIHAIAQPVVYIVFRLGTPQKSPQEDIFTYLNHLPTTTAVNFHPDRYARRMLSPKQKELMRENPDGSKWNIPMLFLAIRLACIHVAPFKDPAWSSDGAGIESSLYMLKQLRNKVVHQASAINKSEFKNIMQRVRETLVDIILEASLRYGKSTTYSNELIQNVHKGVDHVISGDLREPILIEIIEIIHTIYQPLLYQILCIGTPKKQQDFLTYFQSFSNEFTSSKNRKIFTSEDKKIMSENLDGSKWDISLLFKCIKYGCEGLAPFDDRVWTDYGGTQLENYLYRVKSQWNSSFEMGLLVFLHTVDEMCQTCIDTLNAAQLRYQEYMTTSQCDQLIQQVLVHVDQIKQRYQSEDVLLPIVKMYPPGPAITASPPTNTPEPAITASPPTNTPEPAITASPPTNTPEPAITASPPTNTPGPAITASPPTNTPGPAITASQSIDHQGTPSMTDQPSEYYGLKLIKMHWFVLQPCMYHILCLGTQMKPPDKNFIEYLKDLPQPSTACGLEHSTAGITQPIYNVQPLTPPNYKPGDQGIFNAQQKKKIRKDLDGKGFDIALLHPCIKLGCVGVAPQKDPVWINEGTELENCLFLIKKERNDVMHETLKLNESQFLEKVVKLREIIHNTLINTQHRYVHLMSLSECNQYKEKVDKDIDNIRDERLGIDELQKHSLPMLMQMFIPDAADELKEKLNVHNVVTLLDFVKSCDSKEMCLKIQNIFTRIKMVKGKEQTSQTHMDYRKLLTWIQAKAKDKEEEEEEQQEEEEEDKQHEGNEEEQQEEEEEDKQHEGNEEEQQEEEEEDKQHEGNEEEQQEEEEEDKQHEGNEEEQQEEEEEDKQHEGNEEEQQEEEEEDKQHEGTPKPQMLILEGPAGMGKTTLTMLMVNEWLDSVRDTKEESDKRTIEGLDYYDLVLKINCRDSHLTSFEDLLKHYMNKTFCKYRNLLPCLTKECRLLIIIDGYDERNSKSRELIEDVLLHLKHSNNSTILCTTRPEHLVDFIQIVPSEYEKNVMELTGIPVDLRADFMEKYFQEIKRVMGSKESGQELVDKVEREKHKEHYNVPLNLAILAWLFHFQPAKVTDVSSQTELYYHTHQMLKDKLDDRLVMHNLTKNDDKWEREDKIEEWLLEFYQKTFLTLSDNILYLDKPIINDLRSVCRRLKLPPLEVLGAFLTLKTTSEHGTILEQYSIAHKGLQENYAALHILKTFQKHPKNTIIATMENTLGVKIENFKFYLNMFKHLAGLLDLEISNPSEGLIWEIVELIEKAGESSQNAWLDILEEVKISEVFLKAVARCFPIQDGIVVKETRAAVYSILLPLLCPARVIVDIRSDPTPLLPALTNHTCTRVELWHHWYHPNNSTSQLRNLLSCDSLRVFRGHGTVELDRLPASLKELMIAISEDNQARSMLPLLMTQQMHLQHLEVHVTTKVSTEAITNPLPDVTTVFKKPGVSLILSNVKEGEEGWVCEVTAKLQPSQGYWRLEFPRSTVTADGWIQIIEGLHQKRVKVHLLWLSNCNTTQEHRLDDLASNKLGAKLKRMDFTAWEK